MNSLETVFKLVTQRIKASFRLSVLTTFRNSLPLFVIVVSCSTFLSIVRRLCTGGSSSAVAYAPKNNSTYWISKAGLSHPNYVGHHKIFQISKQIPSKNWAKICKQFIDFQIRRNRCIDARFCLSLLGEFRKFRKTGVWIKETFRQ